MEKISPVPCTYGRFIIREFGENDRNDLLVFARDPGQLELMLFTLGNECEIDEFLAMARNEASRQPRLEWHLALEEKESPGHCIGSVALMIEKDHPASAELGYWFKRSSWGKGYATEASRFMLAFGFDILGLHRIWGKCHVRNEASARVMQKLGMELEGTIREHAWLRDHYRSSYLFSILEQEYRLPS